MSPEDAQAAGYDELNHGTGAGGGLLWVGGAWRSVVWIADQIGRVQVISGVVQYFFPEGVGRTPAGGWGNYTPPSHSDFQDNTRRVRILY
ncbi:MAG: hypothetical protein ACK5UE_03985 [Chitinophagales bacterium]|nr:hypothetical protein [Sphingobacteriales bacterium]